MNASLNPSSFYQSYGVVIVLSLVILYAARNISFLVAYSYNYYYWQSLFLFPFSKTLNYFTYAFRMLVHQLPLVTILFLSKNTLQLSFLQLSLLILFLGLLRLNSSDCWIGSITNFKQWCKELGLVNNLSSVHKRKKLKNLFVKLSTPVHSNKSEITRSDFKSYIALSLYLLNMHCLSHEIDNLFSNIDLVGLFLIMWSLFDAWVLNLIVRHKIHANTEKFRQTPKEFIFNFWKRILIISLFIFCFYIDKTYDNSLIYSYFFTFVFFIFVFVNKFYRIWSEAIISQSVLQRMFYPLGHNKDHVVHFESMRAWHDIGAQGSKTVHPFIRFIMFRAVFDFSGKNLILGILNHLDLLIAFFLLIFVL